MFTTSDIEAVAKFNWFILMERHCKLPLYTNNTLSDPYLCFASAYITN